MKRLINLFICTTLFSFIVMSSQPQKTVVFAEIFYDTPLNENDRLNTSHNVGEYVKLQNISSSYVDISGWYVNVQANKAIIHPNTILPPGGIILVHYEYRMPGDNGNLNMANLFPNITWNDQCKGLTHSFFYLGNTKNWITLYDNHNKIQDEIIYAQAPLIAKNGEGKDISLCNSIHRKTVYLDQGIGSFDANEYTVGKVYPYSKENIKVHSYARSDTFPDSPHATLADSIYSVLIDKGTIGNNDNFVSEAVMRSATGVGNVSVTTNNSMITTTYYDGFGRKQQTLVHGGGTGGDIADYYEYNSRGKQEKYWLPTFGGNSGAFTPLNQLMSNYQGVYPDDNIFYSNTDYENSVQSPVSEEKAAGVWHNVDGIKTEYFVNTTSAPFDCRYYFINNVEILCRQGRYAPGELLVKKITDEDGNCRYEFTDKKERIVLMRYVKEKNSTEYIDTHYVYDYFGNLRYVLPPNLCWELGLEDYPADLEMPDNIKMLLDMCYINKYDLRNRCISKKLPGAGSISMVYDSSDLLIYTQDGNQRRDNKYTYFAYDNLGREAFSGIVTDTRGVETLRTEMEKGSVRTNYVGATGVYGYTQVITYAKKIDIKTVNYYDNYLFLDIFASAKAKLVYNEISGYDKRYVSPVDEQSQRGLLTGSLTRVLDVNGTMLVKTIYYDNHGNIIQSREQNTLGGHEINYSRLSFTGKTLEMRHEHSTKDTTNVNVYRYTYDNLERPLTANLAHNSAPEKLLTSNRYDEIGRLIAQNADAPATELNYSYNIRGWVKEIGGPMFMQKLYYSDAPNREYASYNGNISSIEWCDNGYNEAGNFEPNISRRYNFAYDGISRLVKADYSEPTPRTNSMRYELTNQPDYSVRYSYDASSNITSLIRKGMSARQLMDTYEIWSFGEVDKLTMRYNGNQLSKVYDDAEDVLIEQSMDFRDGVDVNDEYAYDANGNMTKDLNKGITNINYNILNLPDKIDFADGHITEYTYDATGRKLCAEYKFDKRFIFAPIGSIDVNIADISNGLSRATRVLPGGNTINPPIAGSIIDGITEAPGLSNMIETKLKRNYCGAFIYKDGALERVLTDNGYIEGGVMHYFLKDYQGNNRMVVNGNNQVVESTDYYPFGMSFGETGSAQPYKYGGKELDRANGLGLYDFSARYHDPALGRFTTIDPMSEKYYSISPYTYCAANPIIYVDPTGAFIETGWDLFSLAVGVTSFVDNVSAGNVGAAIVDGAGVVLDAAAVVLPGVPGGAGAAIKAVKAVDKVADSSKTMKNADAIAEGNAFESAELTKSISEGKNVSGRNRLVPQNGKGNVNGNRTDTDQLIKNDDGSYTIVETKRSSGTPLSPGQKAAEKQVKEGNGMFEVRTNRRSQGLKKGDEIKVKYFDRRNKYE